ncbi:MAG: hypothetical protein JWP64_3011, partial [Pseudonocardia sp.]|nr:hypothetical protein [Pseudonocardia sp.]
SEAGQDPEHTGVGSRVHLRGEHPRF